MAGLSAATRSALRDPRDGTELATIDAAHARFVGGNEYPCIDGRPILLYEDDGLFSIDDVVARSATTQSRTYRDSRQLKNFVRQRVLPGLTWDPVGKERVRSLAAEVAGRPVLVVGAGDRTQGYRELFPDSEVINSDVHLQFDADCVLDAHHIPFRDGYFGLVLAAQVLEHVSRPWIVASEMQRVTALKGIVHIEVPFEFPYHGAPYDFFRYTPTALRFLFSRSSLVDLDVTEGRFSAAAVSLAAGVVDSFDGRLSRQVATAGTRLALWWMRYLDARGSSRSRFNSPKGLYATLRVDGESRSERAMLADVEKLLAEL